MDKNQKAKAQKMARQVNVLESIKDLGTNTSNVVKNDLLKGTSEEFLRQLFGVKQNKKFSGEITPGESLNMGEVYAGQAEENKKLRAQISYERQLSQEEKSRMTERSNELRVQLHALMQEVLNLAKSTQSLGESVEVAAMQAPVNPGIYHVVFFQKLLEFVKGIRAKIDNAGIWLNATNKRAEKKNYWSMYKKKGSSFLLSPDHYSQRSAG